MTRRSLVDTYYEETDDELCEAETTWLLLYDFKGTKPSTKFWANLKRLAAKDIGAGLIQYSVLLTRSRRVAKAAKRLAEHYGAETITFAATQAAT
ncbi:MAG: hypothetical protein Q8O47_05115 [Candidatus Bathyarchaeota archaeon]|nr:hypothetical protein [Candidatus Bathyarchaeota archaeon]